jgi:hypothetical protein
MLIFYYSDNTVSKLDLNKEKTYLDIKKEVYKNKFNSSMNNKNDLVLITLGNIVNDSDEVTCLENQIFLVKINVNVELLKILKDDRLIKLLTDESKRNIIYKILDNPDLLLKLNENEPKYQYQKQLDQIISMSFAISEEQIKSLLDNNLGSIDLVVSSILNL